MPIKKVPAKVPTETSETDKVSSSFVTMETITCLVQAAAEDPARGVVTLVGPSQWGKSHFLREAMRAQGRELVIMNPQCDTPEDVAGWPVRTERTLDFTQPSIIPVEFLERNDWALFIDELDKAREDTLSSLLSLLDPGERRLRRTRLPDGVPIVAAMNSPKRPLPEPLINRLLFVAWPPASGIHGILPQMVSHIGAASLPDVKGLTIEFPERLNAPGSYFKLERWMNDDLFWKDEALRNVVVNGLFPATTVPLILSRLKDLPAPIVWVEWAARCTPAEFAEGFYTMLHTAPLSDRNQALVTLADRAGKDDTKEFMRVFAHALMHSKERTDLIGVGTLDDIARITKALLEELGFGEKA